MFVGIIIISIRHIYYNYLCVVYLLFADSVQHCFKSDCVAEFAFAVSSKLGQTAEARYLALEIFDRYHEYVVVS